MYSNNPPGKPVYKNFGNPDLLTRLSPGCKVLDVGCGAGDNARLIKIRYPNCEIYGITHSYAEREIAQFWMNKCWLADLENINDLKALIDDQVFDVILCSHVLEHLRDPAAILAYLVKYLKPGGEVLIAVPNVLNYRTRCKFLMGKFEYQTTGILDETHLKFFTYFTADRYLLQNVPELKLIEKSVTGSVPLWIFRRYLFPMFLNRSIDKLGSRILPNLFGSEVIIHAKKVI